MNGLYIHIPFCRSKCHYCDFYSVIQAESIPDFIATLEAEIRLKKDYLSDQTIDTLYIGGGTPTLLGADQLELILERINRWFTLSPATEITLEANPDDLDKEYLKSIRSAGFNRISIGVQSFIQTHLSLMNRRHDADQAKNAVELSAQAGFDRISLDLMYGIPGITLAELEFNLKTAAALPANHLSAYHLTLEPGTPFHTWSLGGKLRETDEEESYRQYLLLIGFLRDQDYEQYEISNFARPGERSRHNSKYWLGEPYLGLGPSAHSYNGTHRHWNPRNIGEWMRRIREGGEMEGEYLTRSMKINEHLMTRLRTRGGIKLKEYLIRFGEAEYERMTRVAARAVSQGDLIQDTTNLHFTPEAWFRSDSVLVDLFINA